VGGLFDVAQSMGLDKSEGEDFSQTLAVWGVPDGPFLMLPLIGPSSLRDMPAKFVDRLTDPVAEIDEVAARNSTAVLSLVSFRAELLEFDDLITGDSYIFVRDIYLQRREFLENDGVIEDDFGDLDDY
jgi:phospholipid-binding lipoprotein MlaA